MAFITGTAIADSITGTNQDDLISGLDGNDTVTGGDGNDIIGDGGGNGDDRFFGEDGNDRLFGEVGNDTLDGGPGNDYLDDGDGEDSLVGGDGSDTLNGTQGINTLKGGLGDDCLKGESHEELWGETGDDTLIITEGSNNLLDGGLNNDYLLATFSYGFTGNVLRGGEGDDTYSVRLGYDLGNSTFGMEINDASGSDRLILQNAGGTNQNLYLNGLEAGKMGIARDNTALGIDFNKDEQVVAGDDLVILDFFNASGDGPGSGFIETVGELSGNEIIAALNDDTTPGDYNIIEGTDGPDTLQGTDSPDSILGNGGSDSIDDDGAGDDVLRGGLGNDTLRDSSDSNDLLDGGPDDDILIAGGGDDSLLGGDGNDTLNAQRGADTLDGGDGNDVLAGDGSDSLAGGVGNDTLFADGSNNTIDGGAGNDNLAGTFFNDFTGNVFRGGGGSDIYSITLGLNRISQLGLTIEDTAGNDTLILKNLAGADLSLSASGLERDKIGLARTGSNLAIDLNQDGQYQASSDLTIVNFFNASANGPGPGFIETVGTLSGNEILSTVPNIDDTSPGGVNIVRGTDNADKIAGSDGKDSILGFAGNDTVRGSDGNDTVRGGGGNDSLEGGDGDDRLLGNSGNDVLFGGGGANNLNGGGGNDSLWGNNNDKLVGAAGRDTLLVTGSNNNVQGGGGSDFLVLNSSDSFTGNVLNGDRGNDTYTISLGFGSQFGVEIKDRAGRDALVLNDLFGASPTLSLSGLAAGSIGVVRENRNLAIDLNQDGQIKAADDLTIANFFNASGTGRGSGFIETVAGISGNRILRNVAPSNVIAGNRRGNRLRGTSADERFEAAGGNDRVNAGGGDDTLIGGTGRDLLRGQAGSDSIEGGGGNDRLIGGAGDDVLIGGAGSDRFIFQTNRRFRQRALGVDAIVDFNPSEDSIILDRTTFRNLDIIDGNGLAARDFAVVNSNNAATLSNASIVYNQSNGGLFYNSDGSDPGFGIGDRFATLQGQPNIDSTDFIIAR
jgi:Ca2+-binding RTX toxin-like protein